MKKVEEFIEQGFKIKEQKIAGDDCILVAPDGFEVKWDKDNLIYRASIWRKEDLFPVSLSFKKFFNYGEQIQLFPDPTSLKNASALQKLDGSTCVISRYKGELIIRTRETFDIYVHNNADEIDFLKEKYPKVFNSDLLEDHSIITEWVSPQNIIVLHYPKPELYLTNVIKHSDYSYFTQDQLDALGEKLEVPRPIRYVFESIPHMIDNISAWKGLEGVCFYYNKDQNIKKIKSLDYLARHAFKNEMSLKNMLEMFFGFGRPQTFQIFYESIEKSFDFECANMAIPLVSKVIDAKKECDKIIEHMISFIEPLKNVPRKDAALKIMSSYGKSIKSGLAFTLLDGKELKEKELKKLMEQLLQ